MMMNTLSSSPKPPFQEKEKEEKGTAEMDVSKEADVVFVSSIQIAREEEVRQSGEILKFQPLLLAFFVSLLFSLFRANESEKTRTRRTRHFRRYFTPRAHLSLSLSLSLSYINR